MEQRIPPRLVIVNDDEQTPPAEEKRPRPIPVLRIVTELPTTLD
jgi:hypothetical protein